MNKFLLVPYDIYKGLLQATDNIADNLGFARKEVEKAKNEKSDPSTKNIHLSQVLRRFLHLKKEHDEQPIRITDVGARAGSGTTTTEAITGVQGPAHQSPPPPTPPRPPPLRAIRPRSPTPTMDREQIEEVEVEHVPTQVVPGLYHPSPTIRNQRPKLHRWKETKPYPREKEARKKRRATKPDREEIEEAEVEQVPPTQVVPGIHHPSPTIRHQRQKQNRWKETKPYPREKEARRKKTTGPLAEESEWLSEDEDDDEQLPSTSAQVPSTPSAAQSAVQRQLHRITEEEFFAKPIGELSREQLAWRYHLFMNRNANKYGVRGDLILNDQGRAVPRSSLNFSLIYIIDRNAGRNPPNLRQPPGTKFIEGRINSDTILKSWMSLRKGTKRKAAESEVTKKPSFRPKIWKSNNH